MLDWVTISALATALGTLVLAVATFGSVRSANRAARAAEQALLIGLRPVLLPSQLQDAKQKIHFMDGKWMYLDGGAGGAEFGDQAVYLGLSLRNVGNGLAVLHGWQFYPERLMSGDLPDIAGFHRLQRDLYVPVGSLGYWQGTFRDAKEKDYALARRAIDTRQPMTVDVLYGDHEGGQRVVSRFVLLPRDDGQWFASHSRQWNLDRPDPR